MIWIQKIKDFFKVPPDEFYTFIPQDDITINELAQIELIPVFDRYVYKKTNQWGIFAYYRNILPVEVQRHFCLREETI